MSEPNGNLVPALWYEEWRTTRTQAQSDICKAFRVEPWMIGLGQKPPLWRRWLHRLTGRRYHPWP